jgi:hypothetical protein
MQVLSTRAHAHAAIAAAKCVWINFVVVIRDVAADLLRQTAFKKNTHT